MGDRRLSAVQYLKFQREADPTAIGCTFSDLAGEVELTKEQKNALSEDLASTIN